MRVEPPVSKSKFMSRTRSIKLILASGKGGSGMGVGLTFIPMINRGLATAEFKTFFDGKERTDYIATFQPEMYYHGDVYSSAYVMQHTLVNTIDFATLCFGTYLRGNKDMLLNPSSRRNYDTVYGEFLRPILYMTYENICQLEHELTVDDKELFIEDCYRYVNILKKSITNGTADFSKFFVEPGNSMDTYLINLILFLSSGNTSLLKQWAYWSHHE